MTLSFYKYQGTGNDFVIIDNRKLIFPDNNRNELVYKLCNRRFGIGADGLILIEKSEEHSFRMVYFNSDGNESTMCGNGGRCTVAFAKRLKLFSGEKVTFEAIDGLHDAEIKGSLVKLHMKDVSAINEVEEGFFLNTGSPHVVQWVANSQKVDVFNTGKEIRNSGKFGKGGTNVNFVSKNTDGTLFVRTYERGVEDETYSCGTGVTAAALVSSQIGYHSPVGIKTLGGDLKVYFEKENKKFTDIYLEGLAEFVFKGEISI